MITLITSTFRQATVHQKNALYSWKEAGVSSIILGESDLVEAYPVRTEADLGFEGDAPIVRDMILKGIEHVSTPYVGLINSDILLEPCFLDSFVEMMYTIEPDSFMTSVRRDMEWNEPIRDLQTLLRALSSSWGYHQDASADLFIASVTRLKEFALASPDFIYGRLAWDNWVHLYFDSIGLPCYNTSDVLKCYHQKHDYTHIGVTSFNEIGKSPSVSHNMSLFFASLGKIKRSTSDIIHIRRCFKKPPYHNSKS